MSEHHQAYEELMLANGWLISALAWHGYLTEGRGAIQFNDLEPTLGKTMMFYVSEQQLQSHPLRWPTVHEAEMVQTYDPETTVVLIFPRLGGNGFHSCYGCFVPPPPAAYQQLLPRLDEFIFSQVSAQD